MPTPLHPATAALFDLSPPRPMTGAELRAIRVALADALGLPSIPQHAFAAFLGSTQGTVSDWEGADAVPYLVALAARLALAEAKASRVPAAHRPPVEVLRSLAELAGAVDGAFAGDGADGDDFRRLTFFALGCQPAVLDWRRAFAETEPGPTALAA